MFAHTYFPARYFAPRYFPPADDAPPIPVNDLVPAGGFKKKGWKKKKLEKLRLRKIVEEALFPTEKKPSANEEAVSFTEEEIAMLPGLVASLANNPLMSPDIADFDLLKELILVERDRFQAKREAIERQQRIQKLAEQEIIAMRLAAEQERKEFETRKLKNLLAIYHNLAIKIKAEVIRAKKEEEEDERLLLMLLLH